LISSILDHIAKTNDTCLLMELYSEISRLDLTIDEKAALHAYFTKNPARKEEAVTILLTCGNDEEKVRFLQNLLELVAGNSFVTQALGDIELMTL